ncbi:tail chaperonin [Shewanella phage S0112]|nr:tail chaperonin [Shewanella phage S0112]
MKAFYDLNSCRQIGMGLGPIPWTAIIQYAEHYGLDQDVTEPFVDIVCTMDQAFLDYHNKSIEDNRRAQKLKGNQERKGRPRK